MIAKAPAISCASSDCSVCPTIGECKFGIIMETRFRRCMISATRRSHLNARRDPLLCLPLFFTVKDEKVSQVERNPPAAKDVKKNIIKIPKQQASFFVRARHPYNTHADLAHAQTGLQK